MFARFRSVLRVASYKAGSFRQILLTNNGNRLNSSRQVSALLAGAAGTVVVYAVAKIFDGESLKNYFLEALQQISPRKYRTPVVILIRVCSN